MKNNISSNHHQNLSQMPLCINFSELPNLEMVSFFQHLGKQLIESILGDRKISLEEFLPLSHVDILGKQPAKTMSKAMKRLYYFRRFKSKRLPTLSELATTKINAFSGDQNKWQQNVFNRFALDMGEYQFYQFPEVFLAVTAEAAWRDPRFQHDIAKTMRNYLKHKYIFKTGHMPIPTLSPETFWVLIIFSNSYLLLTQGWFQKMKSGYRKRRRVLERLQNKGIEIALCPGWSRFWDQYILSIANLWTEQPVLSSKVESLYQALKALPYISLLDESNIDDSSKISEESNNDDDDSSTIPILAAKDWENSRPEWL